MGILHFQTSHRINSFISERQQIHIRLKIDINDELLIQCCFTISIKISITMHYATKQHTDDFLSLSFQKCGDIWQTCE